uniref:Uncharacterized protein n=1 Tax=uncultured bacterium fosmid pJB45G2 TaxID=1478065 RepID=A0A0H3U9P8_9BACT|nr:hypothetical protein [uncultured bacterium fosmid pJB45G2]
MELGERHGRLEALGYWTISASEAQCFVWKAPEASGRFRPGSASHGRLPSDGFRLTVTGDLALLHVCRGEQLSFEAARGERPQHLRHRPLQQARLVALRDRLHCA